MTKILAAVALASMALASAHAGEVRHDAQAEAETSSSTGGPFILTDHTGRSVTDEDFRGRFLLIAFGYTHCPDVCPTTLMTLASALHVLGPKARATTPVFVTLDPDRGTPERMKEYVESFGPSFVGLTGPAPYIDDIARKYHVKHARTAGASGDYAIDHTAAIFLVGPDGAYIERFPHEVEAKALASRLDEPSAAGERMTGELDDSFGYQNVSPAERRARIRGVFAAVAERYDVMNDLMSFALHRWWKRRFVASVLNAHAAIVVDLAGGTGDVAIALAKSGKRAIVCDPSVEMMAVGRRRGADVEWVAGEAEALPFATASLDCVTIAFGIRNVTSLERALGEIARVLKPGGSFYCLEFSTPQAWARPFYDLFSFFVIPRLGAAVAQAPEAYTYLVESIRKFPDQERFKAAIAAAGFEAVAYRDLTFGVVSIHSGGSRA